MAAAVAVVTSIGRYVRAVFIGNSLALIYRYFSISTCARSGAIMNDTVSLPHSGHYLGPVFAKLVD